VDFRFENVFLTVIQGHEVGHVGALKKGNEKKFHKMQVECMAG